MNVIDDLEKIKTDLCNVALVFSMYLIRQFLLYEMHVEILISEHDLPLYCRTTFFLFQIYLSINVEENSLRPPSFLSLYYL